MTRATTPPGVHPPWPAQCGLCGQPPQPGVQLGQIAFEARPKQFLSPISVWAGRAATRPGFGGQEIQQGLTLVGLGSRQGERDDRQARSTRTRPIRPGRNT